MKEGYSVQLDEEFIYRFKDLDSTEGTKKFEVQEIIGLVCFILENCFLKIVIQLLKFVFLDLLQYEVKG